MTSKIFMVAGALLLATASTFAQTTLTIDAPANAGSGETFTSCVLYDEEGADPVSGWSYGVAHDFTKLTLDPMSLALGADAATANGGDEPDFAALNAEADGNGDLLGYTCGVVINLFGAESLAPGLGYVLTCADYTSALGDENDCTDITFSSALGMPPVATVIVINSASVLPATNDATVCGTPPIPFVFAVRGSNDSGPEITVGPMEVGSGSALFSIADEAARDTQGFSLGIANDPAVVSPVAATEIGPLAFGPDFFGTTFFPEGWTVGVVYALTGGTDIAFDADGEDCIEVTYENAPTDVDAASALDFSGALGSPPVANVIVVAGESVLPLQESGSIEVGIVTEPTYLRADCNTDGLVNIADAIFTIGTFAYGYSSTCVVACDSNNDGSNGDIADAMWTIDYRFNGGMAPATPFPACGQGGSMDFNVEADIEAGCDDSGCAL